MSGFDGIFGEQFQRMAGEERMSSLNEVFGRLHEMGRRPHYFRVNIVYHPTGRPRRYDGEIAVIVTDGVQILCGWPENGHPGITDPLHWQRFEELRAQVEKELPRFLELIGGPTGDGNGDGYDRAYAAYEQTLKPIRNRFFTVKAFGQAALDGSATLAEAFDRLKLIWTA